MDLTDLDAYVTQAPAQGGASLGYVSLGGEGIALIAPLSLGTTLQGLARSHIQRCFIEAAAAGHQLVLYDQRGAGASRESGPSESWKQRGADLWAVADAAGVERAVLYGVFDAGYTIAEAARQQPERVLGLIFNFTPPVFVAQPDFRAGVPPATVAQWFEDRKLSPHARLVQLLRSVGIPGGDAEVLAAEWEPTMPLDTTAALQALLRGADLRPIVPQLTMRSLVIEPQRRPLMAGWGQALAALLPAGRLVRPDSAGEMLGAIQGFLSVIALAEGAFASRIAPALSGTVGAARTSVTALGRLVVPVVDSVTSERAAEMACRLGEAQRAEIVLVHVVEVPLNRPIGEISQSERERGLRSLGLGQAIVAQHDLPSRARLVTARSAAAGIVQIAAQEHADVIVMALGDKRERGPEEMGRTTREVLRRAPCEVLIDQSDEVPA